EISDVIARAQKLIDLTNQIILCLDTPSDTMISALMSLISQDVPRDQLYSFDEKSVSGKMASPTNRLRVRQDYLRFVLLTILEMYAFRKRIADLSILHRILVITKLA